MAERGNSKLPQARCGISHGIVGVREESDNSGEVVIAEENEGGVELSCRWILPQDGYEAQPGDSGKDVVANGYLRQGV